ncbi:hypothetical protein [Hoeflea sp. BAL378]|uniref:hypothetical protein n=1 Tax=Hoeflea sp. BAL378 TaxID=1547437 RepID=UPI001269A6D0|nr:hypothetical protein [Hoeflea sp. BAL378]
MTFRPRSDPARLPPEAGLRPAIEVLSCCPGLAIDESEVGEELLSRSRKPSIVADAAAVILGAPARKLTGRTLVDDEVLREAGECDFGKYRTGPAGAELALDLYVDR